MEHYDSLIIGTGQAVGSLAPALAALGRRVAIAEHDRVGGTCVNWGCTPTKTLVASARAAHMVRRAADFGIDVDGFSVDFSRVMARQNEIRSGSSEGLAGYLRDTADLYDGTARFLNDHEVDIGGTRISADTIYIHTGARARVPDIPGLDGVPWLDNRAILALEELPEHLLVIGGGYIGMEFAQAFRRFGSRVTVFERRGRLLRTEDADVAEVVREILEDDGIAFECGATIAGVRPEGEGIVVTISRDGSQNEFRGSHLLVGAGRVPNVEALELQNAGVELDERGFIATDDRLRTSVPHIFAIGDVNGRSAFTHTSVHDGLVVVGNLRGEDRSVDERIPIYAMYIDPPLARVGMSEDQARAAAGRYLKGEMPMSRVGRARERAETAGMVKMIVDGETKAVVGGTILGVGGDEVIGMVATWIAEGTPYDQLTRVVLPHPTVGELMPWVFGSLEKIE